MAQAPVLHTLVYSTITAIKYRYCHLYFAKVYTEYLSNSKYSDRSQN